MLNTADILETIKMIEEEHLDIRTVTMGINLLDCADSDINRKWIITKSGNLGNSNTLIEILNYLVRHE